MKKKKLHLGRILFLAIVCFIYLAPIYILLTVSLKSQADTSSYWKFPLSIEFSNFTTAIREGNILQGIKNSTIVTICSVLFITLIGAIAAYPLTRVKTKFNKLVKAFTLGIMMIPPLSILVPLYSTMVSLEGVNTYWGIIVILITFELPMSVFLYCNFIASIPTALDEAAKIDGCTPIQTFLQIILPQLKPVTVSVIILTGLHCWNDYQFSLYFLQESRFKTITLAISSFFSQTTSNLHAAAAAALLAIIPITLVYIFLQKYFVKGMIDSAIK